MESKKYFIKNVFNGAVEILTKSKGKIFLATIVVYVAFLLVYLITKSLLASFVVYGVFSPPLTIFLKNIENEKVENIFKFDRNMLKNFLLSMFFVFMFAILSLLLLAPGIMFFANFALVFCDATDSDIFDRLKNAQTKVKGYKGKLSLISLIFIFICLLCIGIGVMAMWLFSLFIPALTTGASLIWSFINVPMFVFCGVLVGISIFMIFVMPLLFASLVKFEEAIESDKKYKKELLDETIKDIDNPNNKNNDNTFEEDEKDVGDFEDANGDNSDYIF